MVFPCAALTHLIRAIQLFFYRMVKRARRLVTGHTQIARICGVATRPNQPPAHHTAAMSAALWREFTTSRQLAALFGALQQPDFDAERVATSICDQKHIDPRSHVAANLRACVLHFKSVNVLIHCVRERSRQSFVAGLDDHERMLENLWLLLMPGVRREGGRFSKDWGRIGFQQADPASDFRGGGVLALQQLLYIAEHRRPVARRMIVEPSQEVQRYPWACVGINLTMEAIKVLEARKIDHSLYGKSLEQGLVVFHELYCDMFEILHRKWLAANPDNVLSFPPVLKQALGEIDAEISSTGSLVPPPTEA
ncbi:unnamed protein product [Agarophyton chilense]|eukprot:gb/GEZJ01004027.1/.p1 GENE.gb/GEZJ01004027.1/~~gb/GEZJ01004027.1/.p1  ORF type:complete len:343 (-),score=56.06 gb/GEZJ01004027.1/:768-1694(-)